MAQPSGGKFKPVYLAAGLGIAVVLILVVVYVASTGIFASARTTTNNQPLQFSERSQNIVNGVIGVENRSYQSYAFSAPSGSNARVEGRFEASGGQDDIRVAIMDADGFTNYQNGHTFTCYYCSAVQTVGNIEVNVPTGETLYLVYDNKFSLLTDKSVRTTVDLIYTN